MTCFLVPYYCLDEEFDAPDIAADYQLCHAIATGKMGLHPDGWGNHDPLPLRWLLRRRTEPLQERVYVSPDDPVWEAQPKPKPELKPKPKPEPMYWSLLEPKPKPKPKPKPPPTWYPPPQAWGDRNGGDIKLTCDECGRRFPKILRYPPRMRPSYVVLIRGLGRDEGWTCIVGRDRCPTCSQLPAPEAVGDGAGTDQRDE